MGAPRQVKKAAQKAKDIQKDLLGAQTTPPTDPPVQAAPATPPAAPANPKADPPVDPPAKQVEDWEIRYKNLRDSRDEKSNELRSELSKSTEQIDNLTAQMNGLTEQLNKLAANPEPVTPAPPEISNEEMDEYGPGLIKLVTRIASSSGGSTEAAKQILDLEKRMEQLEAGHKDVVETTALTAKELFFNELEKLVPDWVSINNDPEFVAYLAEYVPGTRFERQYFLHQSQEDHDAEKVAEMFNAFKESRGLGAPQVLTVDEDEDPLEVHLTPDSSSGGEIDTVNAGGKGKKIWTKGEITIFYNDKSRGKYRGKEKEARKIEIDIHEAYKEGRIK